MLYQKVFTNKEEYCTKNYDHIYNARHKIKILQYSLPKTEQLERSTFYMKMSLLKKIGKSTNDWK